MLTFVIVTKNRWTELQQAIDSILNQRLTCEVIVLDDGSTDDTPNKILHYGNRITYKRFQEFAGCIVRRNQGISMSATTYVCSIDDDCLLEYADITENMRDFLLRHRCDVVAWPYKNMHSPEAVLCNAPDDRLWQINSFRGCSFIIKKDVFLAAGCFRECFIHQGEEEDLSIRLMKKGIPVFLGRGNFISHYESINRDLKRMDYFGSRNIILHNFFNVPSILLIPSLLLILFSLFFSD